jgi:hypothetical protein
MRRLADRLTHRTLTLFGLAVFALAGAAATYTLPLVLHHGSWIEQEANAPTALFLGLLLSFTGATTVRAFTTTRDRSTK